jgi:hypothetical protein
MLFSENVSIFYIDKHNDKISKNLTKGDIVVLKEMIWSTFEKTGKIDLYLFYKEIDQKKEKKNVSN